MYVGSGRRRVSFVISWFLARSPSSMPPPPRSALATAPTQNSSVESSLSTFVRSLPRELSRAVKWRIRALSEHTWETELSPVPDGIISLGAHQPLLGAPLDGWIRNLASPTRRYMVTEVGYETWLLLAAFARPRRPRTCSSPCSRLYPTSELSLRLTSAPAHNACVSVPLLKLCAVACDAHPRGYYSRI